MGLSRARPIPELARPVVAKAIAAAPGARFQTMSQLRDALEQLAAATIRPAQEQAYHTTLVRAVVAGVAVIACGLLVIPLWSRIGTSGSQTVSLPAIAATDTVAAPPAAPSASAAPTGSEAAPAATRPRRASEPRARSAAPDPAVVEPTPSNQEGESAAVEDVRGYVDQGSPAYEPASPPQRTTPAPPRVTRPAPTKRAAPGRPRTVLEANQGLRQTMGDVIRIGLAEDVGEATPGTLVLHMAEGGLGVPSALYNLQRLYLAYSAANRERDSVAIELRQDGRPYAWFTREGLRFAPGAAERR